MATLTCLIRYVARKLGDFEGAAADYSHALAVAPGSVRAYNNLAFCLARLGRFAEAVAAYDSALRLDPGNVHAWHNRLRRPRDTGLFVETSCTKAKR